MRSLEDVQEIRAYFFGNEAQKKHVYERFIIPYFQQANIPFHAERDWYGGPNYRVVTMDKKLDIALFKQAFVHYCNEQFGVLNEIQLQENVEAYVKNTAIVSQMERRENKAISIDRHLQVEYLPIDTNYVKKRFHSSNHFLIHTELLFIMQTFMNEHIHAFSSLSKEKQMEFTTRAFHDVLSLSKYEEKYAVLVYISNIEGVLAIAESLGMKERYLKIYNQMFDHLNPHSFFLNEEYQVFFGTAWMKTIEKIHAKIAAQLSLLEADEERYFSHAEQHDLLLHNIKEIDSDFHNQLVAKNIDKLLQHEEHQIFKVLINIIYKAIHMLGVRFNEKNADIYFVCRYVLERNDTTWDAILQERGENFVF
ncbi:hypothetical protein J9303_01530 [Bacillaceae bacterium Marseille-Q3522]|nr:hypothetical protein [Bacillaceae bacterium Marseille-Q3522]